MNAMFIGSIGTGKTTLIQRLTHDYIHYDKTQAVEYLNRQPNPDLPISYIDTPGEYMQVRSFWTALTTTAHDADIICLLQDASSRDCWFSGGISCKFAKPVIGVVTKIDKYSSNLVLAEKYLLHAGCQAVYFVSARSDVGIDILHQGILQSIQDYKAQNRFRYSYDYFD